ncbi:hypothetical protein BWD13_18015 [Leptospira santarosai serovar Grippotyphosa]|uniref:Uncharacterized protein n=1 Tax=Leptospira santarosai TaxID=28183 RepID=A0AB73MDI2_9LEPT|nr:hypothetical protein BWD13_18015 [Leptospira santarosai serovar Grippotyphosa]ONF91206.1 hypothetical protein BWD14_18210 [Leptospira santarosai]
MAGVPTNYVSLRPFLGFKRIFYNEARVDDSGFVGIPTFEPNSDFFTPISPNPFFFPILENIRKT